MNICHLLSNWKWTERSELVVDLAVAQCKLGENVWLICGQAPPENGSQPDVAFYVRQKGFQHVIVLPEMTKHLRIFSAFRGAKKIHKIISGIRPDMIHCHMRNAHLMAGLNSGKIKDTIWVRSIYNPDHVAWDLRSRWCYRNATHGLIVVREKVRQSAVSRSFPPQKTEIIHPGIDLKRFSPSRRLSGNTNYKSLQGCFVAGVVSRIRKTRRIDIPLEVLHRLQNQYPRLRLLLVGRGRPGAYEKVIEKPAADLGVSDQIFRAGYCRDDDLVAAYRHMQVLLYPMYGSDKTCRTVREALAAGIPVIAPNMGFLPELIRDGQNGFLVKQSPEGFAVALKKLMDSPETLKHISHQALISAQERFNWRHLAEKSLQFYKELRTDNP
jgi:glycosyltransferase involved in cell wall biosynthesis